MPFRHLEADTAMRSDVSKCAHPGRVTGDAVGGVKAPSVVEAWVRALLV